MDHLVELLLCYYEDTASLALHSFPTRRSSDLIPGLWPATTVPAGSVCREPSDTKLGDDGRSVSGERDTADAGQADRKSTRLNSSHSQISYAVFCLKKKIQELLMIHPSSVSQVV